MSAVLSMISSSRDSCDFCHYETMTAADVFGRITGRYCATAANLFKIQVLLSSHYSVLLLLDHERWWQGPYNGLVIMKPHSYLDLTREMFVDLLDVSWQWYGRANQKDGRAKYPSMAWDLLIHAGASQVTPYNPTKESWQFSWHNIS